MTVLYCPFVLEFLLDFLFYGEPVLTQTALEFRARGPPLIQVCVCANHIWGYSGTTQQSATHRQHTFSAKSALKAPENPGGRWLLGRTLTTQRDLWLLSHQVD